MTNRRPARGAWHLMIVASMSTAGIGLAGPARAEAPRLSVLLVVDQMPAQALLRHRPYLRGGGLSALLSDGSVFQQAYFRHATTMTGPGHALLGSGQYGRDTGIVANAWYDRRAHRPVYCVEDPSVHMSTPTARPMSPRNFEGRSLASRVKARYPKSRVLGVSLKDRSAILTVGAGADAAYWFDARAGGFVSSDAFPYDPRPLAFNAGLPGFQVGRGTWTYSLGVATATVCPRDLERTHEAHSGLGAGFPHPVRDLKALLSTPYGNDLLERFVEEVARTYALGENPAGEPDLLAVSFSAYDYMAHAYGPDSCELADATARLDETLDRLLQFLESRVPRARLAVVFTSDHGSAPIPGVRTAAGEDAGYVDLDDPESERQEKTRYGERALSSLPPRRRGLERAAAAAFGYALGERGPFFVASFQRPCLYLDPEGPAQGREEQARYWLKGFLAAQEGVQSVHSVEDFEAKKAPESLALAFRKDRSGDVCVILKPYWMWSESGLGTDHGQPYEYDAHVPLILWGDAVRAGDHLERVSLAQVAPTLAAFLDLPLDGFAEPVPLLERQGRRTKDEGRMEAVPTP